MAKVVYASGIDYVSGSLSKPVKKEGHSCGTYLIGKHRSAATTNPNCTTLFIQQANTYDRNTPLSQREIDARARFTAIAAAVRVRAKDLNKITADQAAFKAQKDQPNGKKTMKSYLWYLEAIAYDEAHEQD